MKANQAGFTAEVDKLNGDQLSGRRCIVCNSDWYIQTLSGPGFTISRVPATVGPGGVQFFMCASHRQD